MPTFIHVTMTNQDADANQGQPLDLVVQVAEVADIDEAMFMYLVNKIGTPAALSCAADVKIDQEGSTAFVRKPTPNIAGIYVFEDRHGVMKDPETMDIVLMKLFPEDFQKPSLPH